MCYGCVIVSCMKGDVYPVESNDGLFFNQVLDAHWGVLNDDDVRSYSCLSYLITLELTQC